LSVALRRSEKSYFKTFGLVIVTNRDHSVFKFNPTQEMLDDIRGIVARESAEDPSSRPPVDDDADEELLF
jgi:hypothetical protein